MFKSLKLMELTLLEFKCDRRDVSVTRESKKEIKTFFERRVVTRKFLAIRPSALTIAKKPRLSPKSALVMEATLIHLANVVTDWSQLVAVKMVTEESKMQSEILLTKFHINCACHIRT